MILVVGLSPTVQRTLLFPAGFALEQVNRARQSLVTASGKAVNVARVIRLLGGDPHLVQILGGDSGHFLARALDDAGVRHMSLAPADGAATRTCTTLLIDGQGATELVEEAPPVTDADVAAIRKAVSELLPRARALCLSGSCPAGVPVDFYADLVREANVLGIPAVVDAQRAPLAAALAARPFLVKPNLDEAAATLGVPRTDDDADLRAAVAGLRAAGAVWALVSHGARGAALGGPDGAFWRITPPRVEAVNAIGSGDSLTAGLLHAFVSEGRPLPDAAVFGTAVAAANALTATSGVVRPEDVRALLPQVRLAAG